MKRMLMILALLALAMNAASVGTYNFVRKAVLAAAAEVVTVQFPSSGVTRSAVFTGASVYCSVACEVTLERNGTAATSTHVMVPDLNKTTYGQARAYYSSNVGVGTVIGRQIIGSGQLIVLDLTRKTLVTGENFTIRTDSITGTVVINVVWEEF